MSRLTLIASLMAVVALVACASPPDDQRQCTTDADCRPTLGCSFNLCHLTSPNSRIVDVILTPPASSPLVSQHLTHVRLDENPFRVQLLDPIVLTGDVVKASNRARVNGTITARTPGDIDGTGFVFVGKSSGNGYQISLLPNREYLVSFRPDNDAIPPHTFSWSSDETAQDRSLDIVLPDDSYSAVSGVVAWKEGLGAEGATVTAYALSGLRLTRTQTESWRGYFTMDLPPGTSSVSLRVQPPGTGPQFPAVSTIVDVGESVTVAVKPPREPLPVEVLVTSDESSDGLPQLPLSNVGLTFVLNDTQGLQSLSTTTDELGIAAVDLLAGSYAVTAVPDGQSSYASKTFEISINDTYSNAPQLVSVELSSRTPVQGSIRDEMNQAVDGKIVFERHPDGPNPPGLPSVKSEVLDGAFATHLDPGTYQVSFVPSPQAQAPPYTWENVSITEDIPSIEFTLPPPGIFAMEVVDARGEPVMNCQVQVMAHDSAGEIGFGSDYTGPTGTVVLPVPHEAVKGP